MSSKKNIFLAGAIEGSLLSTKKLTFLNWLLSFGITKEKSTLSDWPDNGSQLSIKTLILLWGKNPSSKR